MRAWATAEGSATKVHGRCKALIACLVAVPLAVLPVLSHSDSGTHRGVEDDLLRTLVRAGPGPVVSVEFAVDADSTRRRVVPDKCQEIGELELNRLARNSELEEAFAFIPARCTWVDVGVDQTRSSVHIERGVIDDLIRMFGKLAVYHIHPRREDETVTYFPAHSDLLGLLLINSRYLNDPGVEVLHRAVTPLGTFEYSFQPGDAAKRAIEVIFSTGLGPYAGENLLFSYARWECENEYHDAVRECLRRTADSARELRTCFPMRAGDFVLDFRESAETAELRRMPVAGYLLAAPRFTVTNKSWRSWQDAGSEVVGPERPCGPDSNWCETVDRRWFADGDVRSSTPSLLRREPPGARKAGR